MVQVLEANPGFGSSLGEALGKGFQKGTSSSIEFAQKMNPKKQQNEELVNQLIGMGINPEDAQLYAKLTTGGQTHYAKDLLEAKKRGIDQFGQSTLKPKNKIQDIQGQYPDEEPQEGLQEMSSESAPKKQGIDQELKEYLTNQDAGLTPAEKVRRSSERYKTGLPKAEEARNKLNTAARDKERLAIMKQLDSTGKLPKNFGRLNVDKEGNLRFPYASSAEAQRFVKTLNEFSAGAKETFGSRVTNFDLAQYLKRFPTLLNSSEGRKQIIQQMETFNKINSVYYKNLKKIIEKAGGVRNIDIDVAESLAEKKSEPKIAELSKKLGEIGRFSTLPSASEFKGRKIKDQETGEILVSDGENWKPVK